MRWKHCWHFLKNLLGGIGASFLLLTLFNHASAEAALAFRSKTHIRNSSSSTVTPTEPAGAAQNDILFMWLEISGNPTVTGPAGWTLLYSIPNATISTYLYWIRRGTTAPSYVVTFSALGFNEVSVSAWKGAAVTGNPYDVTASNPSTTRNPSNPDCPAVTTTVSNTFVIAFGMGWSGWVTTATPPTGYTLVEGGTSGFNDDLGVAYIAKAAIGTEDPGAFSGSSSNDVVAEITVALKPQLPVRHRVINSY